MTRLIFVLATLLVLTTPARAEELEYCYKGKGALDAGNNDLAIEYFTLCIDDGNLTQETRVTVFYIRGNAYYSKGEYDQAIADYDQAIRLKPDHATAFRNRGTAYYLNGEYDRAIADFAQAIRLRPRDALAINNRGSAYDDRGDRDRAIADYDRAIADFTQAIELDTLKGPRKAWPFNNRGNTYRAKGQYDRAIADFDQAIRLNPDYAIAFTNRGLAYDDKGQHDRAITDYDEAIRLEPDYADAITNRGHAKFYLGRFAAAVPDLAKAVESSPKDHYAVLDLYLSQARAGENGLGDLRANARHLDLDEWPGPVISMYLGRTDAEAVAAMGTASATKAEREKRCEAMFYVGQYHLLHGDRQKAAEFFRTAVATDITYFMEYKSAKAELARLE